MFDVNEDILKAKELINSKEIDHTICYDKSPIYICTNEMMNNPFYKALLSNNIDILTVIGSGDHVLNAILLDSINIDAVDICTFAKYYLDFKIAAVNALTYGEFLDSFYGKRPFINELYNKIINHIDNEDTLKFWNSLCSTNHLFKNGKLSPNGLYHSNLFNESRMNISDAVKFNPYLDEDSFYVLKRKLHNNIKINYITGDLFNLDAIRDKKYNFVNLSNVWMYNVALQKVTNECRYKNFVQNLQLADDGKVLSYLVRYSKGSFSSKFYEAYFKNDDNYNLHEVPIDYNVNDALLVYKKK